MNNIPLIFVLASAAAIVLLLLWDRGFVNILESFGIWCLKIARQRRERHLAIALQQKARLRDVMNYNKPLNPILERPQEPEATDQDGGFVNPLIERAIKLFAK